jgi:hypothetical protein
MKVFLNFILKCYINIFLLPFFLLNKSETFKDRILGKIFSFYNQNSNEYHLLNQIPKNTNFFFNRKVNSNETYQSIAILIQGQIINNDDFTMNTVKLYKLLFPKIMIIVSTWEGTPNLQELRNLGIVVLESDKPKNSGYLNINYQIKSTQTGIEYALKNNIKYLLKTRSDQRVTNSQSLNLFLNYINLFKITGNFKLKNRLIFLGNVYNSYLNYAFHLSDFLIFGNINDLKLFFDVDYDKREYNLKFNDIEKFHDEYNYLWLNEGIYPFKVKNISAYNNFIINEKMAPEQYFIYSLSKKLLIIDNNTSLLENYHKFLKDFSIIIDSNLLGFYWFKNYHKYYGFQQYKFSSKSGRLTHAIWTEIYKLNE